MKKILVHHNDKPESIRVKEKLIELLKNNACSVVTENPDIIAVIGGDGTMLSAITKYRDIKVPYIGIDTGTLGFLNTVMRDRLEEILHIKDDKKYSISEYPVLNVESTTVNDSIIREYAFNEILIKHSDPRLMEAKVYINGRPFNYFTGDGFIVSTPIGATGYAIWAGGAAVHSDLQAYQVVPIAANDNSVNRPMKTPMILPLDAKIEFEIIKAEKRNIVVACDGYKVSNEAIKKITIRRSEGEVVKIIRFDNYDYLDLFRRKIIDKDIRKRLE